MQFLMYNFFYLTTTCLTFGLISAEEEQICSIERTASDDLCDGRSVDAVVRFPDEDTYVFRGENLYRLDDKGGIKYGYPARIADKFPGVPSCVDAAFRYEEDVYILKGEQVWKIAYHNVVTGYPQLISREFPGIPNNIDAAFVFGPNSRLYIFKGSLYWRYGSKITTNNPGVDSGYPLNIDEHWKGMPTNIDGAVTHANGRSYFFKGSNYYRYNDAGHRIDTENGKPFIKNLGQNWFGCENVEHDSK